MVPLSLSIAFSTVTAQAIGAGDPIAARRVALLGLRLTAAFALLFSLSIWILRGPITGLYTSDAGVASIALSLVPYLVVFHVCDALQTAASFVLRAYKRALGPMLIYTVTLWGIGLVGGFWVAFEPVFGRPLGVHGIWGAATLSLAIAAAALTAYMLGVSGAAMRQRKREIARDRTDRVQP